MTVGGSVSRMTGSKKKGIDMLILTPRATDSESGSSRSWGMTRARLCVRSVAMN
ncbi:hypothetical protein D3C83_131490 [compost metagenome]